MKTYYLLTSDICNYDPAIPLLNIYPKELNTCVHQKTCTKHSSTVTNSQEL